MSDSKHPNSHLDVQSFVHHEKEPGLARVFGFALLSPV